MTSTIFPAFVPPMMAESAKVPFDSPDWVFEIKLDGYLSAVTQNQPLKVETKGLKTGHFSEPNRL